MAKLIDLPLVDLYNRPKITPAVKAAILKKEDFSSLSTNYCDKVCTLKCKNPNHVILNHSPVDILIIQDHKPFTEGYNSGEVLNQIYSNIVNYLGIRHFKGLSYRITNLMKCEIRTLDITKGKPPAQTKLRRCAPYLLEEIRRSAPKAIISLTTAVTKELGFSTLSNASNRGEIHSNEFVSNVVITLHPKVTTMIRQNSSGQMWGTDFLEVLDRDFEKAGRLVRGTLVIPTLDSALEKYSQNIIVARSLQDVRAFADTLNALSSTAVISYDLETNGLDPFATNAKIITAQFGYRTPEGHIEALVIPLWHRENTWFNPDEAWPFIANILLNPFIKKVGHNIKFDVLYTMVCTGVRIQGIAFDTMLILHNINSGLNKNYGLKRAVWDWIPHTGLGGYEDKLPKLTKLVDDDNEEEEEETDE